MDSKTITPLTNDPLAAMFPNANIGKAEKNKFSSSARDMFKVANYFNFTKEGENMVLESSDVIDFFRNVVPPFLAEVRKNNQSRSTVGDMTSADGSNPVSQAVTSDHTVEGDPVHVIDLVPSEPSSLPVASVADRYTRSMLKCLAGYPLYKPQPFSKLSTEYLRHGVNVGDVGFVRGNGVFEFLFNICPLKNGLTNPPNLSDGFSLETADHSATRVHLPKTCLLQSPITKTKSGEYICEGPEGAILELPEGAIQEEATNILPFEKLAARHGVQWYEYTMARGRKISNGSLYLITSFTKCAHWGIAVLDRPCGPGQGLKFDKKISLPSGKSTSKYHWKGSHGFPTKISNQRNAPNQCVFLRGYKLMIRQDIFDNLCNGQPHGSDLAIPSLVHPSDLINAALLSQNPGAKVALTHDDVWCDLLQDNFPKLNYAALINIARSYTSTIDEYDRVSLAKYVVLSCFTRAARPQLEPRARSPDSSNVLEESHHLLQGIETSAVQATLTTPDDGNTPLPATISVTLLRELVDRILLLLDTKSILTCKLVNKEFNEIIQSSILLQYFLACKAAGVIDNPRSPLSYAERLEALKKWEEAWRKLKPVFEMAIDGIHQTASSICYMIEGVHFVSDHNLKGLVYCHLTSFPQDIPRWKRIPGHGPALDWPGILVNFSAALHEHDLIINFISSDVGNQTDMQRHSLDLVLLKFSTGEYHPLARRPKIHVQQSSGVEPWVTPRIVGDNLAMIIRSRDLTSSKLFIFDWKTGHKRLEHKATADAYLTLDFISPELLLVPNLILSHLEVWHLPLSHPNSTPPIQILTLQIPAVSPKYSLFDFSCRAEPKPFLHSTPHFSSRPFFPSPENSIIVVRLRMSSGSFNSPRCVSYHLIMHRRALLDTIQKWTSPSFLEQQKYLPMWLTNKVTVHQIADPEDGSVQLDAQSKLVSTRPESSPRTSDFPTFAPSQTSRTFPTLRISPNSGSLSVSSGLSTNSSASRCAFLQVPWAKWGPPISRWFKLNETQARWTGHYNGQRYAFSEPNPLDSRKLMINVADFNPYNSRRHAETMARFRFEVLDHKGVFSEEVCMGLKCVVYRAPDEYDFDLLLMDEQRLFGVKLNGDGWKESIKALYIG